jgi:hypothetical protein
MKGARFLARFAAAAEGAAAVEMALVGSIMAGALMNVAELGRYAYTTTQVINASQAGVHMAIARCAADKTPVTLRCPGVEDLVTSAIRSTSLGSAVTVQGDLEEAWYCVGEDGDLEEIATVAETKPRDCEEAGEKDRIPGLYLTVEVAHTFEPLFPGLTLVENFPETIVRSARMRLA